MSGGPRNLQTVAGEMIDAHGHVFPLVNGLVGDGPTEGFGHGRARIGDRQVRLLPDLGPTTGFAPADSVARPDAQGIEWAVLLPGPLRGERRALAVEAVRAFPGRFDGRPVVSRTVSR